MFSELVDTVAQRSGRVDRRLDIISWTNLTVQEMAGKHCFFKNFVEDQIEVTTDPVIFPRPARLQKFRTARYDGIDSPDGFPNFCPPGRAQAQYTRFYYANGISYIFKGAVSYIDIGYYQFPKKLAYYDADVRPATYDFEAEEWSYLDAYDVDDDTREVARDLVSNWVLRDYYELTMEGVLGKAFKAVGDVTRSATHFSFFEKTYADMFLGNEVYETLDR